MALKCRMANLVYFDARTKIHLKKYLKARNDQNPALFVSTRSPYHRLKSGGVEIMLKKMGKQTNVTHCYPHKFRLYKAWCGSFLRSQVFYCFNKWKTIKI